MRRADRHRRGDGGEQDQPQQHALQLEILGGQQEAGPPPAGAAQEREACEPPAPAQRLGVVRAGAREIVAQQVEAEGDQQIGREGPGQFDGVDLPPVDGGDHRPQDEGEIARRRRALEQAPNQFGADEQVLPDRRLRPLRQRARRRVRPGTGPVSGDDRHERAPGGSANRIKNIKKTI